MEGAFHINERCAGPRSGPRRPGSRALRSPRRTRPSTSSAPAATAVWFTRPPLVAMRSFVNHS